VSLRATTDTDIKQWLRVQKVGVVVRLLKSKSMSKDAVRREKISLSEKNWRREMEGRDKMPKMAKRHKKNEERRGERKEQERKS